MHHDGPDTSERDEPAALGKWLAQYGPGDTSGIGPPTPLAAKSDPDPEGEATPPTPSDPPHRWPWIAALVGAVLIGAGLTIAVLGFSGMLGEPETAARAVTPVVERVTDDAPRNANLEDVSAIADLVIPSTVTVESIIDSALGGGSGVVLDGDGHIVTNNHVVEDADDVSVIFSDGTRYPAEIVGRDALTDIAVLRVNRNDVTPITTTETSSLSIGASTVAVGSPLGLRGGPSVTTGVVSATGRSLPVEGGSRLYGLLQTDAPITRGSSGGALVDDNGRLIGITTAIAVSDVGAEGLGFAVPTELVTSVATDLIADGEVSHAMLGMRGQTATASNGEAVVSNGVEVTETPNGSAFVAAGGEAGDIIASINDASVNSIEGLITQLRYLRAGDTATITIRRNGNETTLDVELDRWRD